ncbi:peptidylprolyl isomerase [Roseobacter sp. YSTF-M11]|uniref:peptidylprolyl isomerase n=1 Tax=Roseobacter insulae TaxID=2859783 RepID=A0A9X1FS39_9RHOB|nr:peptidylprolyl isomerase [Roseobacter insulae]MBW4706764.1 peptidylprolyl isomerase [Roseobacter insulae]
MQKHLKILATAALMASIASQVWAQDDAAAEPVTAQTVVATVNGVEIKLGHMIAARASLPQQYQELADDVLYDGILEQLVQQSALAQKFEGDLPPRVAMSLDNEKRSLIAAEVVEAVLAEAVTEDAVQELYDRQYGDIDPEEEYNASHILVETEEEALAVKETIDGGADFAATAREKSTGPSGPGGGELGWFGAGMMVPTFEAATIALSVGEVSAPVQTQFGWHIIKLNDTRKAAIPTIEEVRGDLTNEIRQMAAQQAITEAADAADVQLPADQEIDPAVLKQIDLLE